MDDLVGHSPGDGRHQRHASRRRARTIRVRCGRSLIVNGDGASVTRCTTASHGRIREAAPEVPLAVMRACGRPRSVPSCRPSCPWTRSRRERRIRRADTAGLDRLGVGYHAPVLPRLRRRRLARRRRRPRDRRPAVGEHGGVPAAAAPSGRRRPPARRLTSGGAGPLRVRGRDRWRGSQRGQSCGVDPAPWSAHGRSDRRSCASCWMDIRSTSTRIFTLHQAQILPPPSGRSPSSSAADPAALQRAGRFGDGWFGIWVSAASLRPGGRDDVGRRCRRRTGRAGLAQRTQRVGRRRRRRRRRPRARRSGDGVILRYALRAIRAVGPAGTTKPIAEFLVPYAEAGCHVFNLIVNGRVGTRDRRRGENPPAHRGSLNAAGEGTAGARRARPGAHL